MTSRLALAVLLIPALAFAQSVPEPTNPKAKAHWEAANAASADGKFELAFKELEAAYSIEPATFLLYSLAQTQRLAGHCDKALVYFKRYLYSDITPGQKDATRKAIRECEAQIKQDQPPPPPTQETQPDPWFKNPLGGALAGGSFIALSVSITFFVKSGNSQDRADKAATLGEWRVASEDAASQKTVGAVLLPVSLGLAAGAAYVYWRHGKQSSSTIVSTDGRSIFVGARF